MDNAIIISADEPEHLVLAWLGVLVGMGYRYKIEGPLFRTLDENRLRLQDELKEARKKPREPFNKDGYRIILESGDSDSMKIKVRTIEQHDKG